MNIVVTGAAGFLGRRLIQALLARGELANQAGQAQRIEHITAFDVVPLEGISDPRLSVSTGDIADPAQVERLLTFRKAE